MPSQVTTLAALAGRGILDSLIRLCQSLALLAFQIAYHAQTEPRSLVCRVALGALSFRLHEKQDEVIAEGPGLLFLLRGKGAAFRGRGPSARRGCFGCGSSTS